MPAHFLVQLKNADSCLVDCIGKQSFVIVAKSLSEHKAYIPNVLRVCVCVCNNDQIFCMREQKIAFRVQPGCVAYIIDLCPTHLQAVGTNFVFHGQIFVSYKTSIF